MTVSPMSGHKGTGASRRKTPLARITGPLTRTAHATVGDHSRPPRRPGGSVLDAPCGTGKYFPMLAAAGHRVAGADQSAGMLAQAQARGIAFSLERTALQDLSYVHEFDAVITVDAMENIPPEDWPRVLANLRRAVRPGGLMYLTVEELDLAEIEQAFESLSARRLPAVRGEVIEGDVAGYHYYPGREQAVEWFQHEGLAIVDEGFRRENGWGYRHFLLRTGG